MKIKSIAFVGSKRNRVKEVADIVAKGGYSRVVEPFGGSGVIGVNLKANDFVSESVINDYDKHLINLDKMLDTRDRVVGELQSRGVEKQPDRRLPKDQADVVQEICKDLSADEKKFLSNNFMFSTGRAEYDGSHVKGFVYYRNNTNSDKEREYLSLVNDCVLDSMDYRDFIEKYVHEGDRKTLVILDPPYLNSTQKAYNNAIFFGLSETIGVLKTMNGLKVDFILFNQIHRDTEELLSLFAEYQAELLTERTSSASGIYREDVLAYAKRV